MIEIVTLVLIILIAVEVTAVLVNKTGVVPHRIAKHPVFVDTSSLMDGRILSIARAGFLPRHIIIPRSVTRELQLLADGSDSDKRSRARHGLELVSELQSIESLDVRIFDDGAASGGVDEQLLELTKKYDGSICTMDFNLMKVAETQNTQLLNINQLAQTLRINYLPGERVTLAITQKGNDAHQGIGHLADGTMVVVEQAKSDIGSSVEVEFIRSIQTTAGKMLFAKKVSQKPSAKKSMKPAGRKGHQTTKATSEDRLLSMIDQH